MSIVAGPIYIEILAATYILENNKLSNTVPSLFDNMHFSGLWKGNLAAHYLLNSSLFTFYNLLVPNSVVCFVYLGKIFLSAQYIYIYIYILNLFLVYYHLFFCTLVYYISTKSTHFDLNGFYEVFMIFSENIF